MAPKEFAEVLQTQKADHAVQWVENGSKLVETEAEEVGFCLPL